MSEMIKTAVYSYWAKPFVSKSSYSNFQRRNDLLVSLKLSVEQTRKFFEKVIFYGDHEAISQVCNIIEFDEVYDDIEELNEKKFPSYFYTLSKVIACQKTKVPFVHIENDFYIWNIPQNSKIFSESIIVEDMQQTPYDFIEEVERLIDNNMIIRPGWKQLVKNSKLQIPTKGIYGGVDTNFINEHATEIIRMIGNSENLKIFQRESSRNFYANTHRVCDAWYLGAKFHHYKKIPFNVRQSDINYTHLYSEKKNDPNVSLKLYKRVRKDLPNFMQSINNPTALVYDPVKDFTQFTEQNLNVPNIPSSKKLTFAIAVLNRTEQIEQTLIQNLEDNYLNKENIEFVLIDFGSNDGFRDWIRFQNLRKYTNSEYFKYYETDALDFWHASVAKNTAIHNAVGKIVVTLDCDNYTGLNGGEFVINQFEKNNYKCILHQFNWNSQNGNFGRIAITKSKFNELGGYDQSFLPMGYQDWDLIKRAEAVGTTYINAPDGEYNKAIQNLGGKKLSIANTKQYKQIGWTEMNRINKLKSQHNIYNQKYVANKGYYGMRTKVRRIL